MNPGGTTMSSSQDRTAEKDLPTVPDTMKKILTCLKNPAEKDSACHLRGLSHHRGIFKRLVDYSEDPTNDYRITFRSFSKVKGNDIHGMGVAISNVPFQSFAPLILQLLKDYDLLDVSQMIHSSAILKSSGDKAFESLAESHARVGIHQIMTAIIDQLRNRKVFLVEDHVTIARLRSKVPPVELQHKSDRTVHSYFLTGVLDFLCCSSNVDTFLDNPRLVRKGFEAWENSSAVPPNTTWKTVDEFLSYVKSRAGAFDDLSISQDLSRWQLLVIEAKSRDTPSTYRPAFPPSRDKKATQDSELEAQKLFLLDPDRWLSAHKNLKSLLPPDDNDSCIQLHSTVLDCYLSVVWHSLKNERCHARYIPFEFLDKDSQLNKSRIERFRWVSGLPPLPEHCPLEPVVGVIRHQSRYLVIVVPHGIGQEEEKWIYILGEEAVYDQYSDIYRLGEGDWKGLLNIGYYHGWNMERYKVHHVAWNHIPGNSGPIACEVVKSIMKNGFSSIPTYWCTHDGRLNVLTTVHRSAMRYLGQFLGIHANQRSMPEYIQYFSSRLETVEQDVRNFWKDDDDLDSPSGFASISKKLAESMAKCRHCNIKFACDDPDADTDDDELETQEVEVISGPSTCGSSVHSTISRVHEPGVSDSSKKPTAPQRQQKQRSLKKYIPQAIAECLALHLAPKPARFREDVLKFCVSSSEDWLFGVIDCRDSNHRPCYITDTLTYKFDGETDATKFKDIITWLTTWMCIPAEEILPHMKERAEPL